MSTTFTTLKTLLGSFFLVLFAVLAPIHSVLVATGVLIFADLVVGIWAAKKKKRKITSAGIRRTVVKVLVYQIAIITGFVLEAWLLSDLIPVSKIVAGTVGLVEVKSIFENLNIINGKPVLKGIVDRLKSANDAEKHKE